MGKTSSSVTAPIEGSVVAELDRAPASIHSRMDAIWLGASGLPPFGIAPFCTISYSRLSWGFPGVTTGPSSPPFMTPAKVLRSSPLIFSAELWQGMQLAWNMGSTLVSKVELLSRFSGVDWTKTSAVCRMRMRHTAQSQGIQQYIPP